MTHIAHFTTRVKGGLPVQVEATIAPAEPDVGATSPYIDDMTVMFLSGHPITFDLPPTDQARLDQIAIDAYYEDLETARCVRRYGYEECIKAGIL